MDKEKQLHNFKRGAKEVVNRAKTLHKKTINNVKPTNYNKTVTKSVATSKGQNSVRSSFATTKSRYDFTVKDVGVKKSRATSDSFEAARGYKNFNLQKFNKQGSKVADLALPIEKSFDVLKPALLILIKRTSNNIFFSVSYRNGLPLYQTSGGATGIPGSKRDTPASAETAAKVFFNQVLQRGYHRCYLRIDGMFDNTTRAAVRGLQSSGLITFSKVQHSKVVSHNGVRLPKIRRT